MYFHIYRLRALNSLPVRLIADTSPNYASIWNKSDRILFNELASTTKYHDDLLCNHLISKFNFGKIRKAFSLKYRKTDMNSFLTSIIRMVDTTFFVPEYMNNLG